jgi:glycosyltransferase involved in cell wall biosynthesis
MSLPAVLVVLPAYNAEAYVGQAIQSILAQTYSDFRLMVVDDGSADATAAVCRTYADHRITFRSQSNTGPSQIMNDAVQWGAAEGFKYIARMDADDISLPHRLEKQLDLMEMQPDICACSGSSYYVDAATEAVIGTSSVSSRPSIVRWEVRHGLRGLIQGATVFRVAALEAAGGYRLQFKQGEDTDLFLRLSEHGELSNVRGFVYKIRLRPQSLSVADVRETVYNHFYALDCHRKRVQGMRERAYDEFARNMGWVQKFAAWREIQMLALWRNGMTQHSAFSLAMAGVLDPRRVVSRAARWALQ